jgi:hypothetical protein
VLAHRLIVFKRWGDELKQLPSFLLWFTLAVVELVVENFFVWCDVCAAAYLMVVGTSRRCLRP